MVIGQIKDKAEEAQDKAQDVVKDVKEEAEEKAEDVKEGVDEAKEKAGEKAEDVKEGAKETVDKAKDTAGKAVDKAKDTADKGVDKAEDATGKDLDRDGKVGGGSSGGGGGGSSGGSSSGGSKDSGKDSGSGKKSGSGRSGKSDLKAFQRSLQQQQKDPEDLSKEDTEQALRNREKNPLMDTADPAGSKFLEARKEGLEAKDQAQKTEEKIRDAPENSVFETAEGKKLTRDEALEQAQKQEKKIDERLQEDVDRLEQYRNIQESREDQDNVLSQEQMIDARAGALDWTGKDPKEAVEDRMEEGKPQYGTRTDLGQQKTDKPGDFLRDQATKGEAYADVFLSDKGGKLIASALPGTDKSPQDVVEEEIAEREVTGEKPSALDRAQSPATLVVGGGAGGAAFKGLTRAAATVGPRAAGAVRAAGIGAGAAETGRVAGETAKDLDEGDTTEAGENLVNFGAASAGFVGGSRAFTRKFGPRAGSTSTTQRQLTRQGDSGAEGKGVFQADTNIVTPSLRPGKQPSVQQQVTTGRYGISGRQAQGTYRTRTPQGKERSGEFESISIPGRQGRTQSGQRTQDSTDITRMQEEGRLFRTTKDTRQDTRAVVQNRRDADAEEVFRVFDNVRLRQGEDVRRIDVATVDKGSSSNFGDVRSYVVGGRSGSGSGSTGTTRTGTRTGMQDRGVDNIPDIRSVAQREASETASNMATKGTTTADVTKTDTTEASTSEKGRGQGRDAATFEAGGQQTTRNNVETTSQERNQEDFIGDQDQSAVTRGRSKTRNRADTSLDTPQLQVGRGRQRNREDTMQGLRLGTRTGQKPSTKLGLRSMEKFKTEFPRIKSPKFQATTGQTTTSIGIGTRTRPGRVGLPSLDSGPSSVTGDSSPSEGDPSRGARNGVELDWISSNFVEQKGGTPTFKLGSKALETQFGGLRAVEEGQRNYGENLKNNSGKIW